MLIIRSSKNPEFLELVRRLQLHAECLIPVEGEEHAYRLPAQTVREMPEEMIAVVKYYTRTYEPIVVREYGRPIAVLSGPIALWLSKGCRRTPQNKVLVAIVLSNPLSRPEDDTPTQDSTSQSALATYTPQSNSTEHAKKLSPVPPELSEALKEGAEIVIETAKEGNKALDIEIADILVLDWNEYMVVMKGGIGTITTLYGIFGWIQKKGTEAEPSAPV